mgnify:CR=1 FL=1
MEALRASLNHHAERVWEAVAPGLPGFSVEVLTEIDSTNTELMRRARAGTLSPTLRGHARSQAAAIAAIALQADINFAVIITQRLKCGANILL